jgi:hypothetical protein
MIVIFFLFLLLHTPWLYTWDTCYTIPVKWFFVIWKKAKGAWKHSSKRGDQGRTDSGGRGGEKIALAWLLRKANCEQYYIMPQESLRKKLVGRTYETRTDFEDGLLLCEIISARVVLASSALAFYFPFLIFCTFLSSFLTTTWHDYFDSRAERRHYLCWS